MGKKQGRKVPMGNIPPNQRVNISPDQLFLKISKTNTSMLADIQMMYDGLKMIEGMHARLADELSVIKGKATPKSTMKKEKVRVIKTKKTKRR